MGTGEGNLGAEACMIVNDMVPELTLRYGTHPTVTASDTIATGLKNVLCVVGSFSEAPDADPGLVNLKNGSVDGDIDIETWLANGTGVATAFGIDINWIALGIPI